MAEAAALSTATYKRDWRAAFAAMKKLLADPNDTVQVFRIMQALNGAATKWGYEKLVSTRRKAGAWPIREPSCASS